ncbi:DUF72 domain-containing protein [Cohnella sp. CFH 77786]|uniref:DUF72 domain-containing protein n=1 Tax=Cohnella sp. CFH 77786 TaxID=2662265 RepID=UPI001C6093B4|nr:DUF72 domain-containing protein [Cohnella sp. CFH 77786]MBW5447987.1 DUF72 domain-containing protein [Cohnella sp. CFH 77786]
MIRVGLAGWGEHHRLYPAGTKPQDKLKEYGKRLSTVEVDSSFYALQPPERFQTWADDTPPSFRFVVKAYQVLTGHRRGISPEGSLDAAFEAFRRSLQPVREAGKLAAVLFQYPPWFDCTQGNVRVLREAKERMSGFPCALEFRHQSWFVPEYREKTLRFMEREGWIHSVCDEPQAGASSVPTVLHATHPELTVVRMHGRNEAGWNAGGAPNWREVRYLYHYSEAELAEWKDRLERLARQTREIHVIFNNNSGGHAAGNAVDLMRLLGQEAPRLADPEALPEQLDLFDLP